MWSLGTLAKLNAEAAAALAAKSKDAKSNEDARQLLEEAYRQIRKAASEGEFSIPDPFDGLKMSDRAKRAAREQLVADGYTLAHDGHVSWKKPEKKSRKK